MPIVFPFDHKWRLEKERASQTITVRERWTYITLRRAEAAELREEQQLGVGRRERERRYRELLEITKGKNVVPINAGILKITDISIKKKICHPHQL